MRRFLNGIFVGSLIGGIVSMVVNDNFKPQKKRLMGSTRKLSKRASKVVGEITKDVTDMMKRR